jgi:hypothetical protein
MPNRADVDGRLPRDNLRRERCERALIDRTVLPTQTVLHMASNERSTVCGGGGGGGQRAR